MKYESLLMKRSSISKWIFILAILSCYHISSAEDSEPLNLVKHMDIGVAYGMDIVEPYIYATTNEGFVILDATDPVNPSLVGTLEQGKPWFAVKVSGNTAYAGGKSGFAVVDIADRSNPTVVGRFFDGGEVYDIKLVGNTALVADAGDGLEIIDVSDPAEPRQLCQMPTGQSTRGVAVNDKVAYAADISKGLSVVNISDTRNASLVNTIEIPQGPWGVMVDGDRLYVGCFKGTLVYDISDALDPVYATTLLESEETLGSCGTREQLFVTVSHGISVLNVADIKNPKESGYYSIQGGCHAIRCALGYVYTVRGGLYILRMSDN
jgi:hypothetical protein